MNNKFNKSKNINKKIIDDFGYEWTQLNQSKLPPEEQKKLFDRYFSIFPWNCISKTSIGFDLGCGSGRWSALMAPKVKNLYCIEPSKAIDVAKMNLKKYSNCIFLNNTVENLQLPDASMDFGYSLGVLHHIEDTYEGIRNCVKKLKPKAPFLVYIYYSFDNKTKFYKLLWRISELFRYFISRLSKNTKYHITQILSLFIYYPLAKLSYICDKLGFDVSNFPLHSYKDLSFYTMRTDALDRLGTFLEKRFSKLEIHQMLNDANLGDVIFSEKEPYWCAVGFKKEQLPTDKQLFNKYKISVILPLYNNEKELLILLDSLSHQKLLPHEIIIIDSSENDRSEKIINDFYSSVKIIYKKIGKSNPGSSRNSGVKISKYNWLAFIDSNTIPNSSWLLDSIKGIENNQTLISRGISVGFSNTNFKKVIKALTYGNQNIQTLPGTVIAKSLYDKVGYFSDVRAGEDLEWFQRLDELNVIQYIPRKHYLKYFGFPKNLLKTIFKWFFYTFSNAKVNIINDQKMFYLIAFIIILIIFSNNWNYYIAHLETSPLYVPHITKYIFSFSILFYLLTRGLLRPLLVGEKLSFLLPLNWFYIGFVGLCIDIVKAPGMIFGSIIMISNKIQNILFSK